MKKQKTSLLLLIASISITGYSQESVVASGGDATGTGGSSSYSVGQLDYTSQSGSGGFVTQGVQQPYEIVTLGTDDFAEIKLGMSVFPNPSVDILKLRIDDNKWNNLSYQLFDINGRIISKLKEITASETLVPMQELQQGIYFLNVSNTNKTVKTFKILKK